MPPRVVVTRRLPPTAQAALEKLDADIYQWQEDCAMPRETLLKEVKGAQGILCMLTDKVDDELLGSAGQQLKVVSTMSVGYDHVDIEAIKKRKLPLGYTPDVLTDATADLTALLTLSAARRIKESIDAVRNGEWREWRPNWLCGSQFTQKTLGVVGLGRIGEAVAHRLKAFGISQVLYSGRSEKPEASKRLQAQFVSFDELLAKSDYVVVCCALTKETKEMFNYDAFKKMKRSAVFVNSARGGIVQQDDLVRALEDDLIAAAGLDVTTPEPLPTTSKLLQLPNCIVVPHIGSATLETRDQMGLMAVKNLEAGIQDKALPTSVL
ncbi:D-isomer specific 2-hydroxyacid dehydrogenase [Umbelopsis sp. AD052]|nr:D-isomer specific 2-hydroxyacid dehydrogenase [Umbelopsis sp. AD052]